LIVVAVAVAGEEDGQRQLRPFEMTQA
jgi:hypothetical protein